MNTGQKNFIFFFERWDLRLSTEVQILTDFRSYSEVLKLPYMTSLLYIGQWQPSSLLSVQRVPSVPIFPFHRGQYGASSMPFLKLTGRKRRAIGNRFLQVEKWVGKQGQAM